MQPEAQLAKNTILEKQKIAAMAEQKSFLDPRKGAAQKLDSAKCL
jgi:hypothetical protein